MDFATIIDRTNLFRMEWLVGSMFQFHLKFVSTVCKQIVETLILPILKDYTCIRNDSMDRSKPKLTWYDE